VITTAVRRGLRWLPAAAQAALIFVLSAQPDLHLADEAQLDFVLHKAGHLAVYAVLAALVAWALDLPGVVRARLWTASIVVCLVYGATDELHQSLVQGRHPSAADVAIDTFGALLGLAAYAFLTRNRRSRVPV
jgi:VanZ family protein